MPLPLFAELKLASESRLASIKHLSSFKLLACIEEVLGRWPKARAVHYDMPGLPGLGGQWGRTGIWPNWNLMSNRHATTSDKKLILVNIKANQHITAQYHGHWTRCSVGCSTNRGIIN